MKLLDKIIIGILILCVLVSIQLYYNSRQRECINEPLVYAAKNMEKQHGYPFEGIGMFITPFGVRSPSITFDSNNVTAEYP